MSDDVHVRPVPGPRAQLCWKVSPLMEHCDRLKGHGGRCTWQAEADLAAERIENAHLRDAVQTFEKAYNLAHAVLDGATPATWMASADGTMLVRVLVAPWTAWGARGEQT